MNTTIKRREKLNARSFPADRIEWASKKYNGYRQRIRLGAEICDADGPDIRGGRGGFCR